MLEEVAAAAGEAGLWDELNTDWLCLDCEVMPWSAKAIELIKAQYAPVAASGTSMLSALETLLYCAAGEGRTFAELQTSTTERLQSVLAYRDAYGHYCWNVDGLSDLRLAPFHLLASEGKVHVDRDHAWHMSTLARLAAARSGLIVATAHRVIDLGSESETDQAFAWWSELTAKGGEGIVVKPIDFVARGKKGLLQPAMKCRGPEYLRIIYGPEYLRPDNLERLRERGTAAKRSLALKEFALGVESLSRFVRKAPLRSVHECAFGVLALESEPIDPRL